MNGKTHPDTLQEQKTPRSSQDDQEYVEPEDEG